MTLPIATSRLQEPVTVGISKNLPLDPTTGYLGVAGTVSSKPSASTVIYNSPAAEQISAIPASAVFSLSSIYSRLISTSAARYIQVFLTAPLVNDIPLIVSYQLVQPGGLFQFDLNVPCDLSTGYWVATSTTQDLYTPTGVDEMFTVAYGA